MRTHRINQIAECFQHCILSDRDDPLGSISIDSFAGAVLATFQEHSSCSVRRVIRAIDDLNGCEL
jgi:hypothetical protein